MLLTSQVISITFYSEQEKSEKFCSEALISAWGSFTCCKSTTWDPQLYFPSEGSHTQDFYALKNPLTPARSELANLGCSGEYDNHGTTGVDHNLISMIGSSKSNVNINNNVQLYKIMLISCVINRPTTVCPEILLLATSICNERRENTSKCPEFLSHWSWVARQVN